MLSEAIEFIFMVENHVWKLFIFFVIYFVGKHLNEENQEGDPKPLKDLGEMKKMIWCIKRRSLLFFISSWNPEVFPESGRIHLILHPMQMKTWAKYFLQ